MNRLDQLWFVTRWRWHRGLYLGIFTAKSHDDADDDKQEQNHDDNFAHSECKFPGSGLWTSTIQPTQL